MKTYSTLTPAQETGPERPQADLAEPQHVCPELTAFFAQAPWPLLLLDTTGCILFANEPAAQLLDAPSADCCGLPLADFLHSDDSDVPRTTGEVASLHRRDGTRLLVEVSAGAYQSAGGHALTMVFLRDLSREELLLEERLKTAELVGVFRTIATVNHEINNPLFGMMATTQLLREQLKHASPSVIKKLDMLDECGERIKLTTEKLSRVIRPARRIYAADEGMLDLAQATAQDHPAPPNEKGDPAIDTEAPRQDTWSLT